MEFAAHIRNIDGKVQTVKEHCLGVAVLSEKYADKLGLSSLARLQGIFHDAGKLTSDFNMYVRGDSKFNRGDLDHSFAGARCICEIADEDDKYMRNASRLAARTIISHHGLHDWIDDKGEDYFSKRVSNNERYEEIVRNIGELCSKSEFQKLLKNSAEEYSAIVNKILEISCSNREIFAFYLGMFERFMQSILIDADRTDTADFMSDSRTERHFDTSGLWVNMHDCMEEKQRTFQNKTDCISSQRRDISQRCAEFAKHKVGTCRLIVPTGGGKTLSSLRFAIEYCRNYDMDKIIYVAPYMSILEQNSDEIRSIAGDENFLEHHSNVLQEIDNKEELSEYELRTEKWDSPVIATTMVQFFNSLFLAKNSSVRRMHRLSRAVIIIDEVQSVPLKCVHLFNLAVNFLTKICGSTVVLCSATQPVFESGKYPLILDEQSSMTGDYSQDFEIFKRTELVSKIKTSGYTYEQAADFCYEKYLESGSLLAVVNTKASAATLYELVTERNKTATDSEKAEVIHLSTNMCPQHRREKIAYIREMLQAHKKVICVTTQLIEAGVDISFGCVVRSLAGMDNAAQAAGRCNRNGEINKICPVFIINIRDEKLVKMNELKSAQAQSRLIIDSGNFFDLLAVDTMSVYFQKLYKEQEDILSYNVEKLSETLVNLLSLNKNRQQLKKNPYLRYCGQAFQTAGKNFNIIDEATDDIIVPYNEEAEDIILKLNSEIGPQETAELLRTAQKYTVGIYKKVKDALNEAGAITCLKCGALSLKSEFYNSSLGVTVNRREMEVLMF